MTSWIWMKGVEVPIADPPINPINHHDTRPAVKDLITKHRKAIDQVKNAINTDPLYDATKHDDLWLLRFVLSYKKKTNHDAIKAALDTLKFRSEHKLDIKDIRSMDPFGPHTNNESVRRYVSYCTDDALTFSIPDPQRGVLGFLNMAGIDQHALVSNLDESDWFPTFLTVTEWQFQWLDYITRTTGRLTKAVRVVDMSQLKFKDINRECSKRDATAMGVMENNFPQLLEKVFICHSPAFIQVPWRILRPIIPKRLVSKIDFINPLKNSKEKNQLLGFVVEDNLPDRFGGTYKIWPVAYPIPKVQM